MHLEYINNEDTPGFGSFDLVFDKDQSTDQSLKDSVIISLFCWKRADDEEGENYGYWARELGSLLWVTRRAKITDRLISVIKGTIEGALQWMIDDGVADSIAVTVQQDPANQSRIGALIVIGKNGDTRLFRFADLWNGV